MRRRQAAQQEKTNNTSKGKKGKLRCIIMCILMILVYYQLVGLFNYTFGNKTSKNSLVMYRCINKVLPSEGK